MVEIAKQLPVEIFEFAALIADEVVVGINICVVTQHPRFVGDFMDKSNVPQGVQGVINGRPRSHGQVAIELFNHFVSRRVNRRLLQKFKDGVALGGNFQSLAL